MQAIIEYTRALAAHMGHPVDGWTDDEVLQLAASWGLTPVLIVGLVDQHGDPLQASTVH